MVQWVTCNGWCPNLAKRVFAQPKWSILPELILVSIPSPLPPIWRDTNPLQGYPLAFLQASLTSWFTPGWREALLMQLKVFCSRTQHNSLDRCQPGPLKSMNLSPWHLPLGRCIPTWGLLAIFLVTSCSGNLDMLWYCRLQDLRAEFYLFPQDDEEPQDTKFQIDGSYIPRIFILGE